MPEANNEGASAPGYEPNLSPEQIAAINRLEKKINHVEDELKEHEKDTGEEPGAKQKVSMGRDVFFRDVHHGDFPAKVVRVNEDGTVNLQVFRGDHMVHSHHLVSEIKADEKSGGGWFWPPRV